MKKALRTNSHPATGFARRFLLTRSRGRLIALLVIVVMAVALAVTTMSLAKSQKNSSSDSAKKSDTSTQVSTLSAPVKTPAAQGQVVRTQEQKPVNGETTERKPKELKMVRARSFDGDLRQLPYSPPVLQERPEREPPEIIPTVYGSTAVVSKPLPTVGSRAPIGGPNRPMPGPIANFKCIDFEN